MICKKAAAFPARIISSTCASEDVFAGGRRQDVIAGGRRTKSRIASPAYDACGTDTVKGSVSLCCSAGNWDRVVLW